MRFRRPRRPPNTVVVASQTRIDPPLASDRLVSPVPSCHFRPFRLQHPSQTTCDTRRDVRNIVYDGFVVMPEDGLLGVLFGKGGRFLEEPVFTQDGSITRNGRR